MSWLWAAFVVWLLCAAARTWLGWLWDDLTGRSNLLQRRDQERFGEGPRW